MINIVLLLGLATVLTSLVICKPLILSDNTFLMDFVDHEAVALLAVILTITLASIANIHLSINKVILPLRKNRQLLDAASEVKKETREDAWYIFWGFVASIVIVVIKGGTTNTTAIALVHALVLWIYGLYLVCLYDIHKIIFGLADLELTLNGDAPNEEE